MNKSKRGDTEFDKFCHSIYEAATNKKDCYFRRTDIMCEHCGWILEAYYCEDKLYAIRCPHCKTLTLIKADSWNEAVYQARSNELLPVEKMDDEEYAMFWEKIPIMDEPDYVGCVTYHDFPKEMKYGASVRLIGTIGQEFLKKDNEP